MPRKSKYVIQRELEKAELELLRANVIANQPIHKLYAIKYSFHSQYESGADILAVYTDKELAEKECHYLHDCYVQVIEIPVNKIA